MKNLLLLTLLIFSQKVFSQNLYEKISPNPTKDKITISFDNAQMLDFKVVIYDLIGNKVYENSFLHSNSETISLEKLNLNIGFYFVHIYYNEIHKVKRVVYSP